MTKTNRRADSGVSILNLPECDKPLYIVLYMVLISIGCTACIKAGSIAALQADHRLCEIFLCRAGTYIDRIIHML